MALADWDFNDRATALYRTFRRGGMNDNQAGNAVIDTYAKRGANPFTGPAYPIAPVGEPTATAIDFGDLAPVTDWAPGYSPEYPGEPEPSLGAIPSGAGTYWSEMFETPEGPITISFSGGAGQPITTRGAVAAIIALITAYPQIIDAIKAAFKLIIRRPGRKALEWSQLAILVVLQQIPESHRRALAQYESGLHSPMGLTEAEEDIFATLTLADAINVQEFDFEEHLIEELIGHVATGH